MDGEVEGVDLANRIWKALEQQFTYRLVLELDDLEILRSYLLGQLVVLHKRIHERGGMLRLSGLSENSLRALQACRLDHSFSRYRTRDEAIKSHVRDEFVSDYAPAKPR
jgi:anti-anti-sigma factor